MPPNPNIGGRSLTHCRSLPKEGAFHLEDVTGQAVMVSLPPSPLGKGPCVGYFQEGVESLSWTVRGGWALWVAWRGEPQESSPKSGEVPIGQWAGGGGRLPGAARKLPCKAKVPCRTGHFLSAGACPFLCTSTSSFPSGGLDPPPLAAQHP